MSIGIGTLLFGLALLLVVATVIVLPLFEHKRPVVSPPSLRQSLETERREIIRVIRDLDMDFRLGKMREQDYRALRAAQVQRGADVLRQLDALDGDGVSLAEDELDRQIEAAVGAVRRARQAPAEAVTSAALADVLTSPEVCPSCRQTVQPADRFCRQCGSRLVREQSE